MSVFECDSRRFHVPYLGKDLEESHPESFSGVDDVMFVRSFVRSFVRLLKTVSGMVPFVPP